MKNQRIYKKALKLAVPMMIQNGITNMVSLVDNVMVGRLGTESVTAVSIVGQLIFVFNLAIFGGISGPGIYGAQYHGYGNTEGFKNTFRIKIWICLAAVIGGLLAFTLADEQLISLYLSGEGDKVDPVLTMDYAKQYLSIMILGLPFFAITQVYSSSLRETGKSVKPMVAGVISVVIDVVFNYLLIYGKFGCPRLGVKGAAIATVLARVVEALIVIIWATASKKNHPFLDGIYKTILVPKKEASMIIKKGLPIFFNEFLWASGIAVLTQCYSTRGLEIVSGLNISNALCNLFNVVFVSLGSAVGILTGQSLGASKYEKAQKESFILMRFSGIICIAVASVLIIISGFFTNAYNTSEEIRHYGKVFIIITASFFPVQGVLNALYFTLRSGGKTIVTFLFDSVYSWTLTIPVAFILCRCTSLPIFAVYIIVQAADIIKLIVGYTLIKRGKWISNIVEHQEAI